MVISPGERKFECILHRKLSATREKRTVIEESSQQNLLDFKQKRYATKREKKSCQIRGFGMITKKYNRAQKKRWNEIKMPFCSGRGGDFRTANSYSWRNTVT